MARRNKNRPDPLFEAIRADDLETVRFLIETQPERINSIAPKYPLDTRGMSPLQVALCTGWYRRLCFSLYTRAKPLYPFGAARFNALPRPLKSGLKPAKLMQNANALPHQRRWFIWQS